LFTTNILMSAKESPLHIMLYSLLWFSL